MLADRQVDELVNDFVRQIPGVLQALLVSGDGLKLATSDEIAEAHADHLAAVAAGLVSLTGGAARCLRAEPVRQTIVEMGGGYLFVTSINAEAALAVFADVECDIGLVGYEMALLVGRLAQVRMPAPRTTNEDFPRR
jgi:predicted regulator of Ras-like GTPase activity (Roadblock/LC7/MglB family)